MIVQGQQTRIRLNVSRVNRFERRLFKIVVRIDRIALINNVDCPKLQTEPILTSPKTQTLSAR